MRSKESTRFGMVEGGGHLCYGLIHLERRQTGKGQERQDTSVHHSVFSCLFPSIHGSIFFIVGSCICTFIQQTLGVSIVPALLKGLGNTLVNKIPACISSHSSKSPGSWEGGVSGGRCWESGTSGLWTKDLGGTGLLGGETRAKPRPGLGLGPWASKWC